MKNKIHKIIQRKSLSSVEEEQKISKECILAIKSDEFWKEKYKNHINIKRGDYFRLYSFLISLSEKEKEKLEVLIKIWYIKKIENQIETQLFDLDELKQDIKK